MSAQPINPPGRAVRAVSTEPGQPGYQVGRKSFIFFAIPARMRSTPKPGNATQT
jgi:hypothetical protein